MIKLPDWLPEIGPRDERLRAASGLYPKRDGWYKSFGGRTRYVCKPCPVKEAIDILEARKGELGGAGGAVTPVPGHLMSIEQLVETFLARMFERLKGESGGKKLARQTYDDYVRTLEAFVDVVGPDRRATTIGPDDFSAYIKHLAGKAPSTVRRHIQYVDRLFNWAGPGKRTMNWIPFAIRGPDWNKPSDDAIGASAADSDKAYDAVQIASAFELVKDNPLLNAAAHLGLNCAFGPKDCGTLPEAAIDLDAAEIRFARGKTGVARLCPLLPQTVDAIRVYLAHRRKFKSIRPEAEGLLFRTREGMPYARWFGAGEESDAGARDNLLSRRWSQVVHLPFSGLRSTFATHADDWPDQRAIDVVMGHSVGKVGRHIRRHYAKKFSAERARLLVEAVWLRAFGREAPSPRPPAEVAGAAPGPSA